MKEDISKNTMDIATLIEKRRIDGLNISKILEVLVTGTYSA